MDGKTRTGARRSWAALASRVRHITSILAIVLAMLSLYAAGTFLISVTERLLPPSELDQMTIDTIEQIVRRELALTSGQVDGITADLAQLRLQFEGLSEPLDEAKMNLVVAELRSKLDDIQTRLGELEQAILDDPVKALRLPLMRTDLDNLEKAQQAALLAVNQEISRVYDQNKWFIGLMFTMALGLLGLAVSNFLKPKAEDK